MEALTGEKQTLAGELEATFLTTVYQTDIFHLVLFCMSIDY